MAEYAHREIEKKWQDYWERNKTFKVVEDPSVPKEKRRYVLDMFPYPSAAGLHVGHPEGYTATDIFCRYQRMQRVQRPAPDGLGLLRPARRAVRHQDRHPPAHHDRGEHRALPRQIKMLGFSYDWDREIATTDPDYYVDAVDLPQALRKRARLRGRGAGNWCSEALGTVLANEEVVQTPTGCAASAAASRSSAGRCGSGCSGSRPTPTACSTTWTASTGPSRSRRCSATGSAAAKARRSTSPVDKGGGEIAGLHDAARHALRRDLHGARAGASARRRHHDAGAARGGPGLRRAGRAQERPRPHRPGQGEDRRLHRRATPSTRSTARRSRSGSPTTC